jgi:hypothetical protein
MSSLILGFDVRRLEEADLPQMEAIMRARRQIGKQQLDDEELDDALAMMHSGMTKYRDRVVYLGAFKKKVLWCFMSMEFRSEHPDAWVMSFLATNPDVVKTWHYRRNGLDSLWIAAFDVGRKHERKYCYWSLPTAWCTTQERTRKNSTIWKFCKIEQYAQLEAGQMPESELDRWVYGTRPKPYHVTLKRAWRGL